MSRLPIITAYFGMALLAGGALAADLTGSHHADSSQLLVTRAEPDTPRRQDPDDIYCQADQFEFIGTINASSGYSTEVVDDIPADLVGETFDRITLFVGEWLALWIEPLGLRLTIYDDQCPPPLVPDQIFAFDWDDLDAEFYQYVSPMTIYRVTVQLPAPVTITPSLTIGGQVVIDWGEDPPFAGFAMAQYDVLPGCGRLYWDNPPDGFPRWTEQIYDLMYCLGQTTTPAPDDAVAAAPRLLPAAPNPFNPRTTLRFTLPVRDHVQLDILTARGERVTRLIDSWRDAGQHAITWTGRDDEGRPVAGGTYLTRLRTGDGEQISTVTLVR